MRVYFLAAIFYGGPDQIMAVTSGLASVFGVLLIFWNKVTVWFFRILRLFKGSPETAAEKPSLDHQ
jgi:hypothetical protein